MMTNIDNVVLRSLTKIIAYLNQVLKLNQVKILFILNS